MGGRAAGVDGYGRICAGNPVLAGDQCWSDAGAVGRRPGCAVAAGRVVGAPAVVGTGDHMPRRCRPGRGAQRVGGSRSGAVLAIAGRSVGVAGCIAMEPARDASVGVAGWGVADKFSSGCDQYRHRERARVPGNGRPAGRAGMRDWVCGTRPGFLPAGLGAGRRSDGARGAGTGRRHSRCGGSTGGR